MTSSTRKVDFNKICKDYGIRVCSYQSLRKKNDSWPQKHEVLDFFLQSGGGVSFAVNGGKPVIIFDADLEKSEIRHIIAHELGHILLGHLSFREDVESKMPDFAETEANIFAAVLMANDILCRYGQEAAV